MSEKKTPKQRKPHKPHRKFDIERQKLYVEALERGLPRYAAAEAAGVSARAVLYFRKEHPEFDAAILESELIAIERVEDALYEAAISGNVTAIQVFLYNRAPQRWSDRRNFAHQVDFHMQAIGEVDPQQLGDLVEAALKEKENDSRAGPETGK